MATAAVRNMGAMNLHMQHVLCMLCHFAAVTGNARALHAPGEVTATCTASTECKM